MIRSIYHDNNKQVMLIRIMAYKVVCGYEIKSDEQLKLENLRPIYGAENSWKYWWAQRPVKSSTSPE